MTDSPTTPVPPHPTTRPADPDDLVALPGIGPVLAADLRAVGIADAAALRRVGPDEAAALLAGSGRHDCAHARRALHRAVTAAEPADPDPPPVLGVDNVLFAVGDLDAALEHYAGGLGLPLAFRLPDPPIALLRLGAEAAGLLLREERSVAPGPAGARSPRVWLEVADADAAGRALTARGVAVGPVFAVATGRTLEIADAWGNVVGLTDYSGAPDRGRAGGRPS